MLSTPNSIEPAENEILEAGGRQGLSWRAAIIGLILVALTCLAIGYAELVIKDTQIGLLQMPPVAIATLTLLALLTKGVQKLSKRFALNRAELLMIYSMLLLSAMLSSRGWMEKCLPLLVTLNYQGANETTWQETFVPNTPQWSVPFDVKGETRQYVSSRFFESLRSGEVIPWQLWVKPVLVWSVLGLLTFWTFLCLASLLRRQWVEHERLAFPLAQLPLEMTSPSGSLFTNRLMWVGFAVPASIYLLNGLHQMYPSFPSLTLSIQFSTLWTSPPWSGLTYTQLLFSVAAVGFFYLLPTDLLFSLWFFFLLTRVQDYVAVMAGNQPEYMPLYPTRVFMGYQTAGAYFVLLFSTIYAARPYLRRVWKAATFRPTDLSSKNELLSYPVAFWGMLAGILAMSAWLGVFGMSMWLALFQVVIFVLVIALVMARSVAEGGLLMTETSFRPIDLYRLGAPINTLGAQNLTGMAFSDALLLRDQRGLVLTAFLDSLKFSDGARMSRRSFLPMFALSIGATLVIAAIVQLIIPYRYGGSNLYYYAYAGNNLWAFQNYAGAINASPTNDLTPHFGFLTGILTASGLTYLRMRFFGWPLMPLGYALSASWTMNVFWFPCFVAWLIKVLALRYGGMKWFLLSRPFFLGMVLGEFTMAIFWTIVAALTGAKPPNFPIW